MMKLWACLLACVVVLSACQTTPPVKESSRKRAAILIDDGTKQSETLGYILDEKKFGGTFALELRSLTDQTLCTGTYTTMQRFGDGIVSLNCFGGRIQGEGKFEVKGKKEGHAWGYASVETPRENIKIVFGLTQSEFMARRAALGQ